MQRRSSRMVAAGVVRAVLGAPCLGGNGWVTAIATDEAVVGEDRLAEVEAELAAPSARLDRLPSDRSSGLASSSCRPSGPYAGHAFVFAKPYSSESVSHKSPDPTLLDRTLVPFSYDHELMPRVWFGYVGSNGLGLRYRYWQFDHGGAVSSVPVGGYAFALVASTPLPESEGAFPLRLDSLQTASVTIANALEMHASDVEFTQRIRLGCSRLTVAGGPRYARIDPHYRAIAPRPFLPPRTFAVDRTFKGLGPWVGARVAPLRCPILRPGHRWL